MDGKHEEVGCGLWSVCSVWRPVPSQSRGLWGRPRGGPVLAREAASITPGVTGPRSQNPAILAQSTDVNSYFFTNFRERRTPSERCPESYQWDFGFVVLAPGWPGIIFCLESQPWPLTLCPVPPGTSSSRDVSARGFHSALHLPHGHTRLSTTKPTCPCPPNSLAQQLGQR